MSFPKGIVSLLLLDGVITVGFITPFVVSIYVPDLLYFWLFTIICVFSGAPLVKFVKTAYGVTKRSRQATFGMALFISAFFSWVLFVPAEDGAPSVLWLIPLWVPVVLMCLLKFAQKSSADKIGRGMVILGLYGFFLGVSVVFGVYREKTYFNLFGTIPITGTHGFLLYMTIFSAITLGALAQELRKRRKK